jgi:hypothetical protein
MSGQVVTLSNIRLQTSKEAILIVVLVLMFLVVKSKPFVQAQFPEYERFVHTSMNSEPLENVTYLEKPVFPVLLHDFQVAIGENWSIVAPLVANHSYRVYCYGKWVDNGSTPKTDYDIYVYNPLGMMEGYHTEAAGLPEHLGTTVDDAFFVPRFTGNYTFVLVNDPRESKGAQEATFMIIEDVECNAWHQQYVEGTDSNDVPVLNTSWGFEFVSVNQQVEVYVKVPETLDMYEARLYLMYDPKAANRTALNGVPLPYEPGLYGNQSSTGNLVGGYNLESKEYRGMAYASCEFYGQDMFLNFTSPFSGQNLYHLVFIGEKGSGTIDFLVKTKFGGVNLLPATVPGKVSPNENVTISYVSNSSSLNNATLEYSSDLWKDVQVEEMEVLGNACRVVIPGQAAGTIVDYRVAAHDVLENALAVNGSYSVKYDSVLNFSQSAASARPGENLTIVGSFTPQVADIPVTVYISFGNETREIESFTEADGSFKVYFSPETVGTWVVYARFNGTSSIYGCESPLMMIQIEESTLAKYQYYIFGALAAAIAAGMVIYVKKAKM